MAEFDDLEEQPQPDSNYPNASRSQQIQGGTTQDEARLKMENCDRSKCGCTTWLAFTVAFIHLSASIVVASLSNEIPTKSFATVAITVNILLCFGVVCCRKETVIIWFAFYGILSFVTISCLSPYSIKVTYGLY